MEKALVICNKDSATLAEIINTCNVICRTVILEKIDKNLPTKSLAVGGILSMSTSNNNYLICCVWKKREDSELCDRMFRFEIHMPDLEVMHALIELIRTQYIVTSTQRKQ